MRSSVLRLAGTLAVCVLAVGFTGCGSNNTGKIVGKWRMESSTAKGNGDLQAMKSKGVAMVWDFKSDGTFSLEMVAVNDNAETKMMVQMMNEEMKKQDMKGTYSLGMGDRVNFTIPEGNGKKKSDATNVTVNGDTMTWKDSDGATGTFSRVK